MPCGQREARRNGSPCPETGLAPPRFCGLLGLRLAGGVEPRSGLSSREQGPHLLAEPLWVGRAQPFDPPPPPLLFRAAPVERGVPSHPAGEEPPRSERAYPWLVGDVAEVSLSGGGKGSAVNIPRRPGWVRGVGPRRGIHWPSQGAEFNFCCFSLPGPFLWRPPGEIPWKAPGGLLAPTPAFLTAWGGSRLDSGFY